ncbi:MAG: hypothetical protein FJ098_10685 [Deltaproteobacteria bacterium]|nr:hypothetical protein [Deltaproteobacteria bacterium]
MGRRRNAWVVILLLAAGCAGGEAVGGGGGADGGPTGGDGSPPDLARPAPDTGEEGPTGPGPTCFEGLTCLVDLKNWRGGGLPERSDCLVGMGSGEMDGVDAVLGCVDAFCTAEFEAFEEGGDLELGALYLCIMERCAEPAASCIGGHGQDDCGDALWCLAGCNPFAQLCTTGCLESTSPDQAEKTGRFLQCVFDACALEDLGSTCDVPTACALKCPEVL